MEFSFPDDRAFRIEKSFVQSLQSVKSCEVVVMDRNDALLFIEAKSSSPNPVHKDDLESFFLDIKTKFVDSLFYFFSAKSGRLTKVAQSEIPNSFDSFNHSVGEISIVLIVHGNKTEWMPELSDAFREYMRDITNSLGISSKSIKAVNHSEAKRLGLIVSFEEPVFDA